MRHYIAELGEKVLAGGGISYGEALGLDKVRGADTYFLSAYAARIREVYNGDRVDLCSIVSARTGGCRENCAFCAQSAYHNTGVKPAVNLNEDDILSRARAAEKAGAHRFDIVTSGKGFKAGDPEFGTILQIFGRLRQETKLQLCACLGVIGEEEALALRGAGVTRYNHNLETAESYFPKIVTTHTYRDRLNTIKAVKKSGMEICSGGIIGMGESFAQRMEFAFALQELGVESVPVNVLNPIPGTPLEGEKPLSPLEIIKNMAVFRLILPDRNIRLAGGREVSLRSLQALGLVSGINGMLVGHYLTTRGRGIDEDLTMIRDLGLSY